MLQQRSEGHF